MKKDNGFVTIIKVFVFSVLLIIVITFLSVFAFRVANTLRVKDMSNKQAIKFLYEMPEKERYQYIASCLDSKCLGGQRSRLRNLNIAAKIILENSQDSDEIESMKNADQKNTQDVNGELK